MISIGDFEFASKLENNDKNRQAMQTAIDLLVNNSEEFEFTRNSTHWLFKIMVNNESYEFKVAVDDDLEGKFSDEMFIEDALEAMIKLCAPQNENKATSSTYYKMFAAFIVANGLVSLAKASGVANSMLFSGFGNNKTGDDADQSSAVGRALQQPYPEIFNNNVNGNASEFTKPSGSNPSTQTNAVEYVPDSFIVKVDPTKLSNSKEHKNKKIRGKNLGSTRSHMMEPDFTMYHLNGDELKELKRDNGSAILEVEPVSVISLDPIENEDIRRDLGNNLEFNTLDFLDAVQMSGKEELPQKVPEVKSILYVLDTGGTPDFDEFDTRYQAPLNFIDDEDGDDENSHGTHVASCAVGNKYGVSKNSLLQPVKVMNKYGKGSSQTIISGIFGSIENYKERIRKGEKLKPIMNISIGTFPSPALREAIQAAVNAGFLVVMSAGNNNSNACSYWGGSVSDIPGVLVAGNIEPHGARWPASNYGKCVTAWQNGVSVRAVTGLGTTGIKSGTSMAAPRTAGTAADLWEQYPHLTAQQVIAKMHENTVTYNKPLFHLSSEGTSPTRFDPKKVFLLPQQKLEDIELKLAPAEQGYFNMPLQQSFSELEVGQTIEAKFKVSKTSQGTAAAGSWLELVFASHQFPPNYNVINDLKNEPVVNRDMSAVLKSCPINIKADGVYWIRFKRVDKHSFKCEYGPGDIPGIGAKEVTVGSIYSPSSTGNTVPSSVKFMGMRAASNVGISVTDMQIKVVGGTPTNMPTKKKQKKKQKKNKKKGL